MTPAAREETDALVVGAGPAGAVAAHEIAKHGVRVLLVDRSRFPRDKVCGCALHERALELLDRCGLRSVVDRSLEAGQAQALRMFQVSNEGRSASIELSGGVALSRVVLDAALVEAATRRGVEFEDETAASLDDAEGPAESGHRLVRLRGIGGSRTVRARVLIAADGLGGTFFPRARDPLPSTQRIGASWVTREAPGQYARGTVFMACARDGYVGLVRRGDDSLVAACALRPAAVREAGGVGSAAAAVITAACLPEIPGLRAGQWHGTRRFPVTSAALWGHRSFAIGDAASFVEPFTGQGIAWAIESACAVAPFAAAAVRDWKDELGRQWERVHRRVVLDRQRESRALAWVLRGPVRRGAALSLVSRFPRVGRALARRLSR